MRCTAVINQKGGVGKTTTTVSLGAALALRGERVLLLDLDPQANLTLHLDRRPDLETKTMTNLMVDGAPLREMIVPCSTEGLSVVPADTSLSGVEQVLANRIGRETILREAFEDCQEELPFDHVLIDCPPALGVLSANALVTVDKIVIPMQAEYFSLQGMTKLMEVMELVRRRLNPGLEICMILPCMVNKRANLANEVIDELQRHFGDVLSRNFIRANIKLAEAPSFGRTIFEHAPESNGALDYAAVADEFLKRHAGEKLPPADEPAPALEQTESEPPAAPPPSAEAGESPEMAEEGIA